MVDFERLYLDFIGVLLLQLVDFERLLSHHDKKLEDRLNNEYLAEEWDFGQEKLDVSKFREPPVVCGDSRIQLVRSRISHV